MTKEDIFELGYIAKTHGSKGELQCVIDADLPHHYKDLELVYLLQNDRPIPFFIDKIKFTKPNLLFIQFEDVNNVEKADLLVGLTIFLPLKKLPPLPQGRFYYHELVGATLKDKNLGNIGIINQVLEMPQQFILTAYYKQVEIMVPLHDDFELFFDRNAKTLNLTLPEGLLDVYLTDDEADDNDNDSMLPASK